MQVAKKLLLAIRLIDWGSLPAKYSEYNKQRGTRLSERFLTSHDCILSWKGVAYNILLLFLLSYSCCKVGHNSSSISDLDNGTYPTVNDDNCCSCNYAAYSQVSRVISSHKHFFWETALPKFYQIYFYNQKYFFEIKTDNSSNRSWEY